MFSVNKEELSNTTKAFWYIPFLGVHLEMNSCFLLYPHSPCFVSILMANAFLVVYVRQLMLKDPLREISPVEWKLFYKKSANSVQLKRRHCL